MMAVSAVGGAADSVWTGSVLAAFIYRLSGGSNAVVGYVEAASGMTTLFLGLPLGMCTRQPLRQLTVITIIVLKKNKPRVGIFIMLDSCGPAIVCSFGLLLCLIARGLK